MCAIGSKLLSARMLGRRSGPLMARRGLLVSTRAVLLCTTSRSSARGPDTPQAFGGPGPSSFLGDPKEWGHVLWPLHPTVLDHFSAACFTCLSQAAAVAVAGGQRRKSVLASCECSVTLSLGEALKAG